MSFVPVVRHLDAGVSLVAPDLRGRGRSGALPAPYGLAQHALDVVDVLDHLGVGSAVTMGESMGAYVAVVLAGLHPTRVDRLVLVDGGLPLPIVIPEGFDPAFLVEAGMGPMLERFRKTFPTRAAYFDHWRVHPALQGAWSADFESYLDYDIAETRAPELRTSVSEDAIRGDLLDVAARPDLVPDAFTSLRCPVTLLRATRGMNDEPAPGLSDELVDQWTAVVPQLIDEVVDDTNHYTICLGERGSRRIADHVCGRVVEAGA
jgi:pimeloyl-ACP methyl ester carboxylesterase